MNHVSMEFLGNITVRARVAFYLTIAEKVFEEFDQTDEGYSYTREALDYCWYWLEGKTVTGQALHFYLENLDDTGLMTLACNAKDNPVKEPIWCVLITSLAYTVWHAYISEGEKCLSETICEVDETIIDELIKFSGQCQSFNSNWLELLGNYLFTKYQTNDDAELGNPIRKSEVMMIIES